ncbi:hypothetical protein FBZ83_12647 [Azospirillum brasilense]|uniref:Uncharacterized protein n=1 Tax=Azospirillum brasilense TaxID=192 RepID=A0A560BMX3_AZOBR|nr:hypothetical protein [Azospirillum brasilense]TWA73980.1 hypothetical protein FBZ83_12647 [Azospirillum brasilense]
MCNEECKKDVDGMPEPLKKERLPKKTAQVMLTVYVVFSLALFVYTQFGGSTLTAIQATVTVLVPALFIGCIYTIVQYPYLVVPLAMTVLVLTLSFVSYFCFRILKDIESCDPSPLKVYLNISDCGTSNRTLPLPSQAPSDGSKKPANPLVFNLGDKSWREMRLSNVRFEISNAGSPDAKLNLYIAAQSPQCTVFGVNGRERAVLYAILGYQDGTSAEYLMRPFAQSANNRGAEITEGPNIGSKIPSKVDVRFEGRCG